MVNEGTFVGFRGCDPPNRPLGSVPAQTGPRVVRSNFCKGPNLSWKRAKKEPRVKPKLWGQKVLFDQISEIDRKRVNLATLTPMHSTVNCTSATSYNYDATITFFVIAK